MNFSMDQGVFMLEARKTWVEKKLVLIGPEASPEINGRHFFQGPITYYWLAIMGVLGGWDPVKITFWITALSFISLIFLYKTAEKIGGKREALVAVAIWAGLPKAIDFAGLIWNPSLLLILVPPMLYFGTRAIQEKKWWQFWIWGILMGWGLQCHFQAILMIILALAVLAIKKAKVREWSWWFGGLVSGYLPLLVFDVRNNFYNVKTIWEWLSTRQGGFEIQQFYFLEFLPIGVMAVAKIVSRWKRLTVGLIAGLWLVTAWSIAREENAKGMPIFWHYSDLKKTSDIVAGRVADGFNVVNLLSGDSRFYPLRYLLAVEGKEVRPVDGYERAKQLWVVNYKNNNWKISNNWEMAMAVKMREVNRFEINTQVELIELEQL